MGSKPTGTFTFISPVPGKTYSIPQVIDILNEALAAQKCLIVRREQSMAILPADEPFDARILRRLAPEELDRCGKTEVVCIVVPLQKLVAADVTKDVKKMLGPLGEVIALERANQLVLVDTAGNLQRIYKTLLDLESTARR
jgi:type II secretory pathway component GspD/PulD (secretin)